MALGVVAWVSTHCLSTARSRRVGNSARPAPNFSPLRRRLSQHCSVTGPPPARRRASKIAASAVNGRTPAVEIGRDVRVRDVEFVVIVEVVPAFGNREGDDSTRTRRTAFDQQRMIRRPRQHSLNGTDGLVLSHTIRVKRSRVYRFHSVPRALRALGSCRVGCCLLRSTTPARSCLRFRAVCANTTPDARGETSLHRYAG